MASFFTMEIVWIFHSGYFECFCDVATLLKESVDWKMNTLIWFHCMKKKKKSLMEDKRNNGGAEVPDSSEPQKAHPTGEFVVMA